MKKTLAVHIAENRTLFSIIEPVMKGYELKYIHSERIVPDFSDNQFSDITFSQDIPLITQDFGHDVNKIALILPSEQIYTALLPQNDDDDVRNLKKLCELEIRMNFPDKVYEDFSVSCVRLVNKNVGRKYALAVFVKNNVIENCKYFLSALNIPVTKIIFPFLSVISSLNFNYPEISNENTAIISFGINSSWLVVCAEGKPAYFTLLNDFSNNSISNLKIEFEKSEELLSSKIKYLFMSGEALTPQLMNDFKKSFSKSFTVISRLNAFRMLTTKLDNDYREYCNRMAHVFPACLGAGFPNNFQITNVI